MDGREPLSVVVLFICSCYNCAIAVNLLSEQNVPVDTCCFKRTRIEDQPTNRNDGNQACRIC